MNFDTLKHFLYIANGYTFEETAAEYHTSQSSISREIIELEKELNIKLLDRSKRKAKLTPAGVYFYNGILPIVQSCSMLLADLHSFSQKVEMNIICYPTPYVLNFKKHIKTFMDLHPNIHINTLIDYPDFASTAQLVNYIDNSGSTLIVARKSIVDQTIYTQQHFLCKDYFVTVIPTSHTLAIYDEIELSAFTHSRFVFSKKNGSLSCFSMEACRLAGFSPKSIIYSSNREEALQEVAIGNGIAVFYNEDINSFNIDGLKIQKIKELPEDPFVIGRRNNYDLYTECNQLQNYLINSISAN